MGSACSANATVKTGKLDNESSDLERELPSPDALSPDILRIVTSQKEQNEENPECEDTSKKLSDIAEMLFKQNQTSDKPASVEMGEEKPIELESEQARRRLQKHRASITGPLGSARFSQQRRGSIAYRATESEMQYQVNILEEEERVASPGKALEAPIQPVEASSTEAKPYTYPISPSSPTDKLLASDASWTVVGDGVGINKLRRESITFQRLFVCGESGDFLYHELRDVAMSLIHALRTRQYYMRLARQNFPVKVAKALAAATGKQSKQPAYPDFIDPMERPVFPPDEKHWAVEIKEGIMTVLDTEKKSEVTLPFVNRERFISNRNLLYALVADGPLKTFCYRRLSYLRNKFGLHCLLNEEAEMEQLKSPDRKCRRDFYNVRKVDTHIHAAACMGQKHLLGFIQRKSKTEPDRVVLKKKGKKMTLNEVFQELDLDPIDLNVDSLDVHADRQTFQRFDRFNNLYSPMGASELREIFLKTTNDIGGDYFAEIISEVEKSLVEQKYHLLELRISIYGRSYDEWDSLAKWFISHKLQSTHIRWLIQVPRLYDVYKAKGSIDTFGQILDNLFRPLFEATVAPNKYKDISLFLRHVVGFDSVDDESKTEPGFMKKTSPTPDKWERDTNPSYTYYLYYMYANIARLNHLRHTRGLNTFTLRPHCGEAGSHDHLLIGFMLAQNISHGLVLKKVPVLQYLYYLAEIGICMSPLSNNHLFLEYNKSPFPEFFARGLRVNLSTDDPLQFHLTMEPLMEEYAVAAQVWKFSVCDMCEMAKTSVHVSSFSHNEKKRWLGDNYRKEGAAGNDINKTNVPDIRVAFREETLLEELKLISNAFGHPSKDNMLDDGPSDDNMKKTDETKTPVA